MIRKGTIIIAERIHTCDSILSKALGLRFRRLTVGSAYVFSFKKPERVLMDMFFVFYPIDVVFLDKEFRLIEMKKKFMPFTFYSSDKKASIIIEMNDKSIDKFGLKVGDILSLG